MRYIIFLFIICLICLSLFINIGSVEANNLGTAFGDMLSGAAGPAGYDVAVYSPNSIISTIIQTALSFLGVVFLILMIYGGYLWMTARGNDEQSGKAKNTIVAAIIGIVIVLSAYAISYLVIEKLGNKTLDSSGAAAIDE